MGATGISNAARVTFRLQNNSTFEDFQWSVATAQREGTDVADLIDAMEAAYAADWIGLTGKTTLMELVYSEWQTGPDFTGFHAQRTRIVSGVTQSGGCLPPQCAVVISLLATDDLTLPIRQRRGRFYHGLLSTGSITTDGRIGSTYHGGVQTAAENLDAAMRTVPSTVSGAGFSGLCIAGPTSGLLQSAEQLGVGLAVDTQRRRRQKVAEAIVYVDIP